MYYILIFTCLGIGLFIGYRFPPGPKANCLLQRGVLVTLVVMLAAMGAKLGVSPQVLQQMGRIGVQALLLALFATGGSILAVYLVLERRAKKDRVSERAEEVDL